MSKKTYRVKTSAVSTIIYEIDCENETEARGNYCEGTIVRDEWDYDDIESVVEIDVAEASA